MKHSVDLIRSMKLMNSRHSNTTTTTSLARRALLLLTLLVMSVGSAWGQTWQDGTAYSGTTISKYQKSDVSEVTFDLYSDIIAALPSLTVSNIYVRWDIKDSNGNYFGLSQNEWGDADKVYIYHSPNYHYMFGNDNKFNYYYKAQSWYSETDDALTNTLKVNLKRLSVLSPLDGCTLECFVTDEWTGFGTSGLTSADTEPSFKLKVEVIFNATGKKDDTFSGKLKGSGQALAGGAVVGQPDAIAKSETNATLDFANALAVASGATYVRFYLQKDGEAVDCTGKLAVTGGTTGPEVEHGYYIYKSTGLTAEDVDNEVSLTLSAGEFEDYQVVAVFGVGEPSGTPLREVDWDLKYTYAFEYPFKGDASSATVVEKTFSITESKKTQTLTMAYDIANDKITLKDGSDNTIGEVAVDASAFWSTYGANLNGSQPFYVRWFLQDKFGVEATSVAAAGAIVDGGSSLYAAPEKAGYGLYFSTADGTQALNSIMTIKVDGSKVTDLAQYNLVCTIATTDLTGETFDGVGGTLSHEPNTLVLKYVLKFDNAEWRGTPVASPFKHSKEVLLANESVTTAQLPLGESMHKILSEYGLEHWDDIRSHFHIRWTIAKKNGLGVYEEIEGSEKYLAGTTANMGHQKATNEALYWNSVANSYPYDLSGITSMADVLNVTINKNPGGGVPELAGDWEDYKVFVWISKDLTGQIDDGGTPKKLEREPDELDMFYSFSFFVEDAFQFVHDKGESGRDYYTQSDFTDPVQQYNWDNDTSTKETVSEKIRQAVHTVEYEIYVDPNSSVPVALHLPFEDYTSVGEVLEPSAYIRWYDWKTDVNNSRLAIAGAPANTFLIDGVDASTSTSRGFFMLNNVKNGLQLTHEQTGVTFNPLGMTDEVITIACDVSKYYDGIYSSSADDTRTGFDGLKKPYLMHEPTLSIRYLFVIRPARVIANSIKIGEANFASADEHKFELAEDNGRVCVAIKSGATKFSVRASLPTLDNYFFYDTDGTTLVQGQKIHWEPYYIDDEGEAWIPNEFFNGTSANRIQQFAVSTLSKSYKKVSDPSVTQPVSIGAGSRIHMVGYICGADDSKRKPVVHYELNFINAPAYAFDDTNMPLERTAEYLEEHMTLQATVNFDEIPEAGVTVSNTLTSQEGNHSNLPLAWENAQYGFCYPDVRRIWTGVGDPSGISPIHGDYMLLKSMNATGVSESDTEHYYKYHWYVDSPTLFDYTHTHGDGKYGNFLYVDASDESRTIAKMNFKASLCAGSELCFTAAVANMTSGTNPQMMATVYAVKGTGPTAPRERVVSFHSSELSTVSATTFANGVWYQVYGRIAIPVNINLSSGDVDHYEVVIDNYALDTNGADYCVDELRFYSSTGKMKVDQTGGLCYGDDLSLTAYMTAELLESKMSTTLSATPQPLYYRIFKQTGTSGGKIVYEPYPDASVYDNGGKDYGETTVCKAILTSDGTALDNSTPEKTLQNAGYYFGTDGILYFKIADNKVFNLEQGYDYFFALTKNLPFDAYAPYTDTPSSALSDWANPNDACDVFSNFFVPKKLTIDFKNGTSDVSNVIGSGCGGGTPSVTDYRVVLKYPDDNVASGFRSYTNDDSDDSKNIHFDYYIGKDDGTPEFLAIFRAMRWFRVDYPDATAWPSFTGSETNYSQYGTVLTTAVQAKIILAKSTTFSYSPLVAGTNYFMAMPVETHTPDTHEEICSPVLFSFVVANAGPELVLGFSDVSYPGSYERVVRVGMEQLKNLQGGYTLHVPVQSFKDKNGNGTNDILLENYFTLYGTTDPLIAKAAGKTYEVASTTTKVAEFVNTKSSKPIVNADFMYLPLNFANNAVTFHEGYEYKIHTTFCDVNDESDASACHPDLYLIIKVVPEFVTWDGATTNVNWNNDSNWGRSSRAELYKSADNTQNTATTAQGGIYQNNAEMNAALSPVPNTYVPMKFTYVTLNTETVAPKLGDLAVTAGEVYNGGSMYSGSLAVDASDATENIQYDMLVRYTEQTCQGHMNSSSTVVGAGTADVYDCEKFYGNVCKEIYFKPDMELLNQQYLTYEKAWVEKELTSNKWYLMSTPLRDTYAGDIFAPVSMTDVTNGTTVEGRQATEAFQPITFPDQATALYSRTNYPFYQHSWGNTFGSTVRVASNDSYRTDYSAALAVTTVNIGWGHSFNDVQVPYTSRTAFAVRAHKKAQGNVALIRLPKTNLSYNYYDWKDTNPTAEPKTPDAKAVNKDGYGKLLVDKTQHAVSYTVDVSTLQSVDGYVLVGNPYMASIDMASFLSANGLNYYFTYNDALPSGGGTIKPMQAFFVNKSSGNLTFTPAMMVDGHASSALAPVRQTPALTLTAENSHGSSQACVMMGEDGQTVETLFDSNLEEMPMVYTVATDGKAVSINRLKALQTVCFGVTCKGDEAVSVTLTGMDTIEGDLYMVDAVDGKTTKVDEGSVMEIVPNEYGRYFLTRSAASDEMENDVAEAVVVSVHNGMVTVNARQALGAVRALSVSGATVYQSSGCGNTVQFPLQQGVYIVETDGAAGYKTMKVFVR